jgi:hypothetical protein
MRKTAGGANRRIRSRSAVTTRRSSPSNSSSSTATLAPVGAADETSSSLIKALEFIASIVAPAAFISGLLYYFGWVRIGAQYRYFGIDQKLFGFTTSDYLLRSADAAFRPVASLLVGGACLLLVGRIIAITYARNARLGQFLLIALAVASCILFAISILSIYQLAAIGTPLFAASALIIAILCAELVASIGFPAAMTSAGTLLRRTLVLSIVIFGSFWACAVYAQDIGNRYGLYFASNLQLRPHVIVYSVEDLQLSGPGISARKMPGEGGYRYRYSGLVSLLYANNRWFLLPQGWHRGGGDYAIVLVDSGTVRVELAPDR